MSNKYNSSKTDGDSEHTNDDDFSASAVNDNNRDPPGGAGGAAIAIDDSESDEDEEYEVYTGKTINGKPVVRSNYGTLGGVA